MIRFFIKSVFFLLFIFVIISFFVKKPNNDNSSSPIATNITTSDAATALKEAINDLRKFCERNIQTCETGKSFLGSIGERARNGAKTAYEYLDRTFGDNDTIQSQNIDPKENSLSTIKEMN
ncbi:DUF5330 domain-containing protein [Bartonella bacilliformis]|uniref:DUF5330 domain-containing protein n=1 Tax=Bartonella bacilliformis TaxID=774 RepID=UPI00049FA6C7|nr:DUF5330 domain-containing protein [Bartonella bacilliformis]KEG23749.1 hypothetical protein H708_00371 [Bartonella bacilliformis VAB9028]